MEVELKGFHKVEYKSRLGSYSRIEKILFNIGKVKAQVRLEDGRLILTFHNLELSKKLKEVFQSDKYNSFRNNLKQKEDGIPPTSKEVGILPKII